MLPSRSGINDKGKMPMEKEKVYPPRLPGKLSLASSPKNGGLELNITEINGLRSVNDFSQFENYTSMMLYQPQTCPNKGRIPVKLLQDDEKNLSLDNKTTTPNSSQCFKKPLSLKDLSLDSNTITPTSSYKIKETLTHNKFLTYEQPRSTKNKAKTTTASTPQGMYILDSKKTSQDSRKFRLALAQSTIDSPLRDLPLNPRETDNTYPQKVWFMDAGKVKEEGVENHVLQKGRSFTPDNLTSRKMESDQQIDQRTVKLTPKCVKHTYQSSQQNQVRDERRTANLEEKGLRVDSRKVSNGKPLKMKENVKVSSAKNETLGDPTITKAKRQNSPGYPLFRTMKGSNPNILSSIANQTGSSSTKNPKRLIDSQTYIQTGDYERNLSSTENTFNGTQDTSTCTKGLGRRDGNREDSTNRTVKIKGLMRARSHDGSSQMDGTLSDLASLEKSNKALMTTTPSVTIVKPTTKLLAMKPRVRECKKQGISNSVHIKEEQFINCHKGGETNDKASCLLPTREPQTNLCVGQNKLIDNHQIAMLYKIMLRTNNLLNVYKEKEVTWQLEKRALLERINMLEEKGDE